MKAENRYSGSGTTAPYKEYPYQHTQQQQQQQQAHLNFNFETPLASALSAAVNGVRAHSRQQQQRRSSIYSDRDSNGSAGGVSALGRGRRARGTRTISMKSASKGVTKKSRTMDYTNYAYNEAVGRLKLMLADTYATPKLNSSAYMRNNFTEDSDNFSDNLSAIDRPVLSDISKYLSPGQKSRLGGYRSGAKKPFAGAGGAYSASKENLSTPLHYQPSPMTEYYNAPVKPQLAPTESVQAPVEIFNFIEKQEDYIEQLEKESKYCRNELSNLLGKVKDVINENEQLTEHARSELVGLGSGRDKMPQPAMASPSSDSEEHVYSSRKKESTPRKKEQQLVKSPRYASAPNIVYEARISELEAELMQANIDLKRVKNENEDLKRKLANADPLLAITGGGTLVTTNCETHRKQIEHLQQDKSALEDAIRHLQKSLDEAKSQQYSASSKRYVNDLVQMERSQSELEVKHLRDELDRQHERVRELQHEMARRIADERANAERRYNTQVDQLGGDLSNQWEQMAKLQLDVERQKRYETDLKRDLANRNSQIDELKMELRANRSTFLADMAQMSAEKQSLEQEITALRLQLDRAAREAKTETSRFQAEINSLRQRLDRGDADLLHSKREVLRLNDEISNLEKELAYGEMKNEVRPTKKDLDKRISEMQEKHAPPKEVTFSEQIEPPPPTTAATTPTATPRPSLSLGLWPTTTTTASHPLAATSKATTGSSSSAAWLSSANGDACTSAPETADPPLADDILRNITRSTERLAAELAKMPPLPKWQPAGDPTTTTTTGQHKPCACHHNGSGGAKSKCHCHQRWASPLSQRANNNINNHKSNSTAHCHSFGSSLASESCCCNDIRRAYQPLTGLGNYTSATAGPCLLRNDCLPTCPSNTHAQLQSGPHFVLSRACTPVSNVEATADILYHSHEHRTSTPAPPVNCTRCVGGAKPKTRGERSPHGHQPHRLSRRQSHNHSETEPLPWLQQHLVLNQTLSAAFLTPRSHRDCSACQSSCQANLTEPSDVRATAAPPAPQKTKPTKSCCSPSRATIKPQKYFEELLKRNISCEKRIEKAEEYSSKLYETPPACGRKPRAPVKVDVNVRLVPKPPKMKSVTLLPPETYRTTNTEESEIIPDLRLNDVELEDLEEDEAVHEEEMALMLDGMEAEQIED